MDIAIERVKDHLREGECPITCEPLSESNIVVMKCCGAVLSLEGAEMMIQGQRAQCLTNTRQQQHQLWTFCEISAIFSISPKMLLPQNQPQNQPQILWLHFVEKATKFCGRILWYTTKFCGLS